jgi:hypothetical protein
MPGIQAKKPFDLRVEGLAEIAESGRLDLNRVSIDLFPLQFPRSVARFGPTTPKRAANVDERRRNHPFWLVLSHGSPLR